ncbi:Imm41 family immunity protein [Microbulbifer sediminum]|uniref:Imm41 family immunity protein n=1 Tax=Microbulbifer sediminum TaxID=2904250 RepID=UPI001F189E3D|nr:Imm41 family immunity protein [Microbulbifer sediminum]
MNEINRNFAWSNDYSEGSFVAIFHENQAWDDDEYYKLENYLYDECERHSGQSVIPREVVWPAMRIYSYLSQSIGCHFDKDDGFEIKNINRDQLYQRRERLQLIFEGFFKGQMPNKEYLGY